MRIPSKSYLHNKIESKRYVVNLNDLLKFPLKCIVNTNPFPSLAKIH